MVDCGGTLGDVGLRVSEVRRIQAWGCEVGGQRRTKNRGAAGAKAMGDARGLVGVLCAKMMNGGG